MPEAVCNDLGVHYQVTGSGGPTVVMIHGLVVDNLSSLYYALAPGVADRMRVVLYDLRGHGQTERTKSGYGLDQAVDDLWALLDHLDIDEPVYLLGNSYGGTIALEAARRDPDRVRGLVLVEAHAAVPGWGEHLAGQLELAGLALSEADLEEWYASKPGRKLVNLVRRVDGLVNGTSIVDDLTSGRQMAKEELRGVRCPVLAIYGEYSEVIDQARDLESLLPRAEVDIFADCSHSVMMEATATVRELIADWMDRVREDRDVPGRTRRITPGEGEGDGATHREAVDGFFSALRDHGSLTGAPGGAA